MMEEKKTCKTCIHSNRRAQSDLYKYVNYECRISPPGRWDNTVNSSWPVLIDKDNPWCSKHSELKSDTPKRCEMVELYHPHLQGYVKMPKDRYEEIKNSLVPF
jgi:hypothetical protein